MTHCSISGRYKRLFVLFLGCSVVAPVAFGQATTGSISGHVVDSTGRVVVQAQISAQNLDKGLISTATTNNSGDFIFSAMPPDHYKIVVEKSGFDTGSVPAFKLDIDQRANFNIPLKVGEVSVSVTVTDSAPVLQTQGAETGQVIGAREIADLPTLGRDFTTLMLLVPGVVSGGGGNNLNLSVNGQREFSNSVQINGVEVTGTNNDTNVRPSPDAIQEFKIVTSGYAPEFGRASGGAVIIQTKSGTNHIHGSAIFLDRPSGTAANNYYAPAGSKPSLQEKNYGATIGGPIIKDKAFLFLAYEGSRLQDPVYYAGTTLIGQNQVTFDSAGNANLSNLLDPTSGIQVPLFDPYFFQNNGYMQAYAGNIIPVSEISPAGKRIVQQLFPTPQNNSTLGIYGNFPVTQNYPVNNNVANLRADYTFSQSNRLYLTYDVQQGDTATTDPYAGAIPVKGGGGADSGYYDAYENHSIALTYDHTFTPNLLNEARATYLISPDSERGLLDGTNLATKFGIQNANVPGFPATYGFPQITALSNGATTGGSTYLPLNDRENVLGLIDSVDYTLNKHSFKAGYEYRHLNSRSSYSLFPVPDEYFGGEGGSFTSDSTYCYYTYSPCDNANGFYEPYPNSTYPGSVAPFYYTGGADIADLLLGLPQYVFQGLQLTNPKTSANEGSFYVQDYWQVTPKLNLTYGVRYEYLQPWVEENNNMANFNMTTLSVDLAGRGANSRSLVNSNTTNFMPRLGIAYQLRPTTVLRGGFGIFYSPENDSRDVILTENYPFYTEQEFYNDPYYFSYSLDAGAARSTTISIPSGASSINLTTVPGASSQIVNSEPTNFPTGYSKNYNLTLQQQLSNTTSFEVGYLGAASRNLSYEVGNYNVNNHLSSKIGKVNALLPVGISNYDSLQAKIDRNFSHGYGVLISYTWSHNRDNGPAPRDLGKGGDFPQNPFNVNAEYANSDSDVRNNLVASQEIELPFGHGKRFLANPNKWTQGFIGGWQLNSITTLHGGRPINILSDSGNANYPGLRPNLVGNPFVKHRTTSEWFNPAAFQVPAGQYSSTSGGALIVGNAPRNFIYGPGFTDEDLSLFKSFGLPHGMNFQVRVESFNVLNTSRYAQPGNNFGCTVTGAASAQCKPPATFGAITGGLAGANQRVMQFAGRLTF